MRPYKFHRESVAHSDESSEFRCGTYCRGIRRDSLGDILVYFQWVAEWVVLEVVTGGCRVPPALQVVGCRWSAVGCRGAAVSGRGSAVVVVGRGEDRSGSGEGVGVGGWEASAGALVVH